MNLPVSHILPASAFRHISLMIGFMMVLAGFTLIGFLNVYHITNSWMHDIDNSLSIEIPAYDIDDKAILPPNILQQRIEKLKNYIKDDPLIEDINITQPTAMNIETTDNFIQIPAPFFATLTLTKDRAINSEKRLKNNIKRIIPKAKIQEKSDHIKSIERTAITLKSAFLIMMTSIAIITMMMISAIIKTLLKAHESTIQLIHLMGAPTNHIATLFRQAVSKASILGLLIGTALSAIIAISAQSLLNLDQIITHFLIGLAIVNFGFIILSRGTTYWTVLSSLRAMP